MWMIENIWNFSELFWHLPFFQVVLRWWNKSKRRCRKLCVCHIGANVKTSFDRWMRLRHCCLPACHCHSIERTHCVCVFFFRMYECNEWLRFNVKQYKLIYWLEIAFGIHDMNFTSMKCDAMPKHAWNST